ncbi:MAG: hypothetical protein ACJ752_09550 [Gaiellaceae bacterium]
MAKKVIGPTGSRRRRWLFLCTAAAAIVTAVLFIPSAFAVHDTGLFELDGNATNDPAMAGDDWDNVCHQVTGSDCSTTNDTTGATSVSFSTEANPSSSIFTGGGSKDPIDVSSWAWKDAGGLPDKDNLQHGFAVRYSVPPSSTCPGGTAATCDVLYFGSDRFDNSGDAQQGFWFFQNKITLSSTKSGGGFAFNGVHRNGDLLVISDFSNGGGTSFISVYAWNSAVSGNLQLLSQSASANCANQGPGDAFCGIVNAGTITMPWPFLDKSGTTGNGALNGEFYEGGVNLSTLGLAGECFSSVASETRSSTSPTATLKDFVLGQFPNCTPSMVTQASETTASPVVPGHAVHDTATITINGGTTPPDPTGDVEFFLCGPIATGDCSTGGTDIGHGTLDGGATTNDGTASAQSPDVNTAASQLASGRYCFRAEWPGDANYGGTSHTNDTTECFAVKDTSATTTAQRWLPNDTAGVTTGSGSAASGSVAFTLYDSADCTGTVLYTETDSAAPFATSNATVQTASRTVSWRAVFTPSDSNAVQGSTSRCETTTVTVNNDSGP